MSPGPEGTRCRKVAMARAACVLLALPLSACYTPDAARLSAQVERLATAGMPVSTAVDRLERGGFQCDTTSQAPAIDCSRNRHGAVLATCIERVLLQPDAAGRRVDAAMVPPIACAGL